MRYLQILVLLLLLLYGLRQLLCYKIVEISGNFGSMSILLVCVTDNDDSQTTLSDSF